MIQIWPKSILWLGRELAMLIWTCRPGDSDEWVYSGTSQEKEGVIIQKSKIIEWGTIF